MVMYIYLWIVESDSKNCKKLIQVKIGASRPTVIMRSAQSSFCISGMYYYSFQKLFLMNQTKL